jgi:hypothetical protein
VNDVQKFLYQTVLISARAWSREEIAVEYWALRFAVLFLERRGIVHFDNVADGDAHYKEIIDKLRSLAE